MHIVDDRVLVAKSATGSTYFLLEKPLEHEDAFRLEQGLQRAGFDPGPVDGIVDDATRRAVAAYAMQHGAGSASGVITRSMLEALAVGEH